MAHWQRTLKRPVEFAGVGLHSGKPVRIRVSPACAEVPSAVDGVGRTNGIAFRLAHAPERLPIAVSVDAVDPSKSMLCTQLYAADRSWGVSTVEHLMAALTAARITRANVDILESHNNDLVEMPILDGSALPFVRGVCDAGVKELEHGEKLIYVRVARPVEVLLKDKAAWLLPMPPAIPGVTAPTLHASVQVNFAHKGLGSSSFQFSLNSNPDANLHAFERHVAPARTFTFEDEIAWMQTNNLALGGSLANAIVFKSSQEDCKSLHTPPQVLNQDGLLFPDEWVRHKMLDCIGDLGLVGLPLHGHFFSTSPGHALTHTLIRKLFSDPANYELIRI